MALNGKLPSSTLTKLSVGGYLKADAAASFERLRKALPWLTITSVADAYRLYATQERIFRERYKAGAFSPYNDYRRWNGVLYGRTNGAAAAVPGTSNHGKGIAVDIAGLGGFSGARYAELAKIAGSYGWTNTEGRGVNEAWHWVYDSSKDTRKNVTTKRRPKALPTIKRGSANKDFVTLWQNFLIEHGYLKGKADGDFGTLTHAATVRLQKRHGLTPDGVVGRGTWSAAVTGLKPGSRGYDVRILQHLFAMPASRLDYVFGSTTTSYVKAGQRWLGVTADGVPGTNTITAYRKKA